MLERRRREDVQQLAAKFGSSRGGAGGAPAATAAGGAPAGVAEEAGEGYSDLSAAGPALPAAPRMRGGVAHEQGRRPEMEDSHVLLPVLPGAPAAPATALYAVFDGHAGRTVADAAVAEVPRAVAARLAAGDAVPAALRAGFVNADKAMLQSHGHRSTGRQGGAAGPGGATAVVALVHGPVLWVAHVGDSRAVVCDGGAAVPLTRDHRASDPEEARRVEEGGGFVALGRVCATLLVSRALGDYSLKGPDLDNARPVSNVPDVARFALSPQTQFLLLACDGVFDVMDNDEAVRVCSEHLAAGPQRMADELVAAALRKDTTDNVTAAVVTFAAP